MRYVQAANYTRTSGRAVDLIVIHDMEAPERLETAENVAAYFARSSTRASAHYCCDVNSTVQCVNERDVAWHAPGANHNGIGIEQAGYASQSSAAWRDPYSDQMLRGQVAPLIRDIARRHSIPLDYVDAAGLRAGRRGVTTHAQVTAAFRRSTHTDPGPNYPLAYVLRLAREGGRRVPSPASPDIVRRGDSGNGVKFMQALLNIINGRWKLGNGRPLATDGDFGPATETRVKDFQRFVVAMQKLSGKKSGLLDVDGIAGPQTTTALAFWTRAALGK